MGRKGSLGRGVLAGMLGGLVGSLVLKAAIVGVRALKKEPGGTKLDQRGPSHQVADLVVRKVTGHELSAQGRVVGGEIVHYAFGMVVGGIYGGLGELYPWVLAGKGLLFGTGVFLAADESSMPMLGLVKKPWEETTPEQAEHWAMHLAYGVATDLARKVVRGLL